MRRGRILAVDDDALTLDVLREGLGAQGFEVEAVREATLAVPRAMAFGPHLILIDRIMPVLNGGELVRALRAFPRTAQVPVAFLTADDSAHATVRSVRAGAVDVLHKPLDASHFARLAELVEELRKQPLRGPSTPQTQARVLLSLFRREGREGVLRLNPGTPFEGRAVFEAGELRKAEYGPLRGVDALEEMLAFDDGLWSYEAGLPEETTQKVLAPLFTPVPGALSNEPAHGSLRLLLVDDDEALRKLFALQLGRAGFKVTVAEDGREGVQRARADDFDVVLADLDMPRLDGWGMLRELRADFRMRELPVIFLSAHDDYRETLRAARCGAWDYLPKTGRAEDVVDRILRALLPRQRAVASLLLEEPTPLELALVGPRWVLRTLARQRATGALEARDEWASYRVALRDGAPVSADAVSHGRTTSGISALGALLVSRGARGHFRPGPVSDPPTFEQDLERLLDTTCVALNELEERALSRRLDQGGRLEVDAELYALYRRISGDCELRVARALCEEKVPAGRLSAHLELPPEVVGAAVADLLRRRVIRFAA